MFNTLRMLRLFILMDEDSGGGSSGGQPGNEGGSTAPAAETPPDNNLQEPGYFAQLPGEKAKSDAYKALYKHQKLDELTDAYLAEHEELEKLKESSSRSIVVPEKGDKEGAAAFWKKLGVPDNPADYKMAALASIEKEQPELINAIRKGCNRMKLTPKQAEAVGEMIASVSKASALNIAMNIKKNIGAQAERVASLYKDIYPAEIDRKNAAAEDISRYESFLKETGLEELFNGSVLAGNPQIIKAVSAYAKKHGGVVTPKGGTIGAGGKPTGKPAMHESEDWKNFKESRKAGGIQNGRNT